MVDKVVICGVRRGPDLLTAGEIQQSIGRAGRSMSSPGEAVVICQAEDAEYARKCLDSPPPIIRSKLSGVEAVAFHVLPWIDRVHDEESFAAWSARSLSGQQGVLGCTWGEVNDYLYGLGCVDAGGFVTEFGKISVSSYYAPKALDCVRSRMSEIPPDDEFDPFGMSYVFSALVDGKMHCGMELYGRDDYSGSMMARGYFLEDDLAGFCVYDVIMGEPLPPLRHAMSQIRSDFGRMENAVRRVAECEGRIDLFGCIAVSSIMATRRVPYEVACVMRAFDGISRRSACELLDMGIRDFEALQEDLEMVGNFSDELRDELSKLGFIEEAVE